MPRYAEHVPALHAHPREQLRQVCANEVLERDEMMLALERHPARQALRNLHARKVLARPCIVVHLDGEGQRQVRDVREWMPRIDRQRREHREHLRLEVRVECRALVRRHVLDRHDPHAGGIEPGDEHFMQAFPAPLEHFADAQVERLECRVRRQAIGSCLLDSGRHLATQCRHADHVELVQVRAEDRQELQPLEQRSPVILCFMEDAAVELQPRELAVEEKR
jgi:hypothetical protein